MCGIVGFVNHHGRAADDRVLRMMNAAIVHRGPDDEGLYVRGEAALGMRRLSIIDIAGGKQPIQSGDGSQVIIFNGEIYNFRELRSELEGRGREFRTSSDTEVILRLYEQYGADCVQRLRGMFAFAIWDERERSLFLARDRVGKKPLLYSHRPNGSLVFGSEFAAVLQHPEVGREVDEGALDAYVSYMYVPSPRTAFRQIRKLEPGHWLRWKEGQIRIERYWSPDFSRKVKLTRDEAITETTRVLREATQLRLVSDVPLGAFLSGGVDSSAVVAMMAELSARPVKTFSIGFEDQDYSELKYARRVAQHLGAEYHEFIVRPNALEILPTLVRHYGEPYGDSSAVPSYCVAREARQHVTVALNGDGGDESFAGYERHVAMKFAERYRAVPAALRKALERVITAIPVPLNFRNRLVRLQRFLKAASLPRAERYFRWTTAFDEPFKSRLYAKEFRGRLNGSRPIEPLCKSLDGETGIGIIDSTLLTDLENYLPNDLLVKIDIASMANSLEARSPFLDHKLIEFAASLPEHIKQRGAGTKSLLKQVAAKLVPRDVVYRKKMGFGAPIGSWLATSMHQFARGVLLSDRATRRGIFAAEQVKQLLDQHAARQQDHASRLWTMLMLELWFEAFVD